MGRGAQQSTRNLTNQQLASQNQYIGQLQGQAQQENSLLLPSITGLLNSQGFTPAQQSAITQEGMGSARTAFDSLREMAGNRVAATNNAAGYGELTSQLGREEAQNLAQQARQNQIDFANEKLGQNLAGINALTNVYGIDTNLLSNAMRIPPELLGVDASVSNGSSLYGLGGLGSLIGGVGYGLGSIFG
jgi:hypothetical protein